MHFDQDNVIMTVPSETGAHEPDVLQALQSLGGQS